MLRNFGGPSRFLTAKWTSPKAREPTSLVAGVDLVPNFFYWFARSLNYSLNKAEEQHYLFSRLFLPTSRLDFVSGQSSSAFPSLSLLLTIVRRGCSSSSADDLRMPDAS